MSDEMTDTRRKIFATLAVEAAALPGQHANACRAWKRHHIDAAQVEARLGTEARDAWLTLKTAVKDFHGAAGRGVMRQAEPSARGVSHE